MSSYASVTIDGMTVFDTQNYYHEWYFRRADRVLLDVNAKEHYDDPDWDPHEVKRLYQYRTTAKILRRRLELAGFHWAALQQEFNLQKKQLLEDIDGMISIDPGGRTEKYKPIIEASRLEDWVGRIAIIKKDGLRASVYGMDVMDYDDLLLDFMLKTDIVYSNNPGAGDFGLPCQSLEANAVALLSICADDAPCILDITDLVESGWTDSFEDLVEYNQESTTFYQIFKKSLQDSESLIQLDPENKTLLKLLYASVITAMETYLSDTIKKQILNREALRRRFVRSHPSFSKNIKLSEIYEKLGTLEDEIIAEIDKISFHNMEKTPALFKAVLDTNFPSENMGQLIQAVDIRHDIVHRNGKNTKGKMTEIVKGDVLELLDLVDSTVRFLDTQIKDGLLDDDAQESEG